MLEMAVSASTTVADAVLFIQDVEGRADFMLRYKDTTWDNDDAQMVDLVDDYTANVTLVISTVSLRIRLGPGRKLLILPIFESMTVRKVYCFITDKEARNNFRLEYKRNSWDYSWIGRVMNMVDNFVVNV